MSILVQREFQVGPSARAEFERQGREGLWPALLHFGVPMVAYGTWAFGGPTDVVVGHTSYVDLTHWAATQQGSGAYYQDPAMRAEIASFLPVYGGRGELSAGSTARLFEMDDSVSRPRPFARRPGEQLAETPPTFGRGSVISERTLAVSPADRPEFRRLSSDIIWPWFEAHGGRPVGLGNDLMGPSDELTTWFAFRSPAEWHFLQHPSVVGAPAEVVAAFTKRADLVRQRGGRLLVVGTDFGHQV